MSIIKLSSDDRAHQSTPDNGLHIAKIKICHAGSATQIIWQQHILTVKWHAEPLPYLKVGDQVVFSHISGDIIILARVHSHNENPYHGFTQQQQQLILSWGNSHIMLNQSGLLKLVNEHSKISMTAAGHVRILSNKFEQRSRTECKLSGSCIYLN